MHVHVYMAEGMKQAKQQLPQRKLKIGGCSHSISYVQNIKVQRKRLILFVCNQLPLLRHFH